jgi:hypothetical protein
MTPFLYSWMDEAGANVGGGRVRIGYGWRARVEEHTLTKKRTRGNRRYQAGTCPGADISKQLNARGDRPLISLSGVWQSAALPDNLRVRDIKSAPAMPPDPTSLEDVIATEALERRVPRVRNLPAEARAMAELKRVLAGSPRAVLQKLVETAQDLCQAQSAGISLLEESDGRPVFRWHAITGQWGHLLWNTLPRELSPCGTVLDRREALLMIDPQRYFTPLVQIPPRVAEVLLVPFAVRGETVGTVWVIAHDSGRQFDREDRRIVSELTVFAAAAYERLLSFKADDILELSRLYLMQDPKQVQDPKQIEEPTQVEAPKQAPKPPAPDRPA